jgi:hypothetical protein
MWVDEAKKIDPRRDIRSKYDCIRMKERFEETLANLEAGKKTGD